MVTYIIRRLLYSVLVLIAASFLVFTFVAKGAGDPLGPPASRRTSTRRASTGSPRRSTSTTRSSCATATGRATPSRTASATTLLTNKPILPDLWQ